MDTIILIAQIIIGIGISSIPLILPAVVIYVHHQNKKVETNGL